MFKIHIFPANPPSRLRTRGWRFRLASIRSIAVRTFSFIETQRRVMIAPGSPAMCCNGHRLPNTCIRAAEQPEHSFQRHEQLSVRSGHEPRHSCDAANRMPPVQSCQARPRSGWRLCLPRARDNRPGVRRDSYFLCVFADAPSRYGKFGSSSAFMDRACAYALTCVLALYCARRMRARRLKAKAGEALVIRTSPYTESHLPM